AAADLPVAVLLGDLAVDVDVAERVAERPGVAVELEVGDLRLGELAELVGRDRVERGLHDLSAGAPLEALVGLHDRGRELLLEVLRHARARPRAVALAERRDVALGGVAGVAGVVAATARRGRQGHGDEAREGGDTAHVMNLPGGAVRDLTRPPP